MRLWSEISEDGHTWGITFLKKLLVTNNGFKSEFSAIGCEKALSLPSTKQYDICKVYKTLQSLKTAKNFTPILPPLTAGKQVIVFLDQPSCIITRNVADSITISQPSSLHHSYCTHHEVFGSMQEIVHTGNSATYPALHSKRCPHLDRRKDRPRLTPR
jgi:hypothetical protein